MPARFYTDINLNQTFSNNILLVVSEKLFHHIITVRRFRIGEHLVLFNGNGIDYLCQINSKAKKKLQVKLLEKIETKSELSQNIHLYFALTANKSMDFTIQKSVELGVKHLTPIICEYSQYLPKNKISSRLIHWQAIAISALEQCGRNCIINLNIPIKFSELPFQNTLAADFEGEDINCWLNKNKFQNLSNINLVVGPEGGFSKSEKEMLKLNFQIVNLGKNILRSETAAIYLISKVIY